MKQSDDTTCIQIAQELLIYITSFYSSFKFYKQPKEITDIKKFMKLWSTNKDAPATGAKKIVYVKNNKKITKFKLRGKKYLYTFKTADQKIAKGIRDAIPATFTKVEIKGKNSKKATKRA